ncbi:hypothetical protein AMATHDRAFT_67646 [Amanita thiersii Skay4041]|uniref:Uncharacterized protein n=1 Tax=Amanita thiersii Skay4041 TaxID=703135 RepID=A0A2A9NA45_9AGAR|nr:hypothetical protein AMATHDRAFT_67646 [Amanita thiersii Skay4041]
MENQESKKKLHEEEEEVVSDEEWPDPPEDDDHRGQGVIYSAGAKGGPNGGVKNVKQGK